MIDRFQLNAALAYSRHWDCRLGEALVAQGFLTEQNLRTFLVKQFNLPQVNLITSKISKDVLNYLPESRAREYCVIPVDRITHRGVIHLIVAMPDPTNLHVIDTLQFLTECWVIPTMASADLILHTIDLNYGITAKRVAQKGQYVAPESVLSSYDQSEYFKVDNLKLNYRVKTLEGFFVKLLQLLIEDKPSSVRKLEKLLISFMDENINTK